MVKTPKNPQEKQQNTDIWAKLSSDHWRYITARIENPDFSKKAAAAYIAVSDHTVYGWPKYVDECLKEAIGNIHQAAIEQRKQFLLKAMAVKLKGLESEDESIQQKVATELIEWELGKATNKTELTGEGGGAIIIQTGMSLDDL